MDDQQHVVQRFPTATAGCSSGSMKTGSAFASSPFPRLQLFEFHERSWFPTSFRNAITEVLRAVSFEMRIDDAVRPVLQDLLRETGADTVVDLCSGAGGPILRVEERLRSSHALAVLLTDKYPNLAAFRHAEEGSGGSVKGYDESVDAMNVPPALTGLRTLFNAFHHFPPAAARSILADAYQKQQPIAIFEITERSFANTASIFFTSFIGMLLLMPRMRSRRPEWWLFTYLLPILPAAFGWDGFVSCLRSYTEEEFRQLTHDLTDENYRWMSGRLRVGATPMHVNYFLGVPGKNTTAPASGGTQGR
jgi:hypothetical protein